MANLKVNICGINFPNPVMTAAGPSSKDGDLCLAAAKGGAGGIVTKTISVSPAEVPRPCMANINSGFINVELWSELPKEQWFEIEYKKAKNAKVPIVISIGHTAYQIKELAPFVKPYADAIEISTHYVGTDVTPFVEAIKVAKEEFDVPVFMKISPQTDIKPIVKAIEDAGADGIVMVNSFGPCMSIDVNTGHPIIGSKTGYGWLSGVSIRPLAIRCVYEAYQVVNIPIIGVGGITNGKDAAEMFMAGASAVQVCTQAILKGSNVYGRITRELNAFLDEKGYKDVNEIKGLAHKKVEERKFRTYPIPPVVSYSDCVKCGTCRTSCVYGAITVDGKLHIDKNKCFGCGLCVTKCPKRALKMPLK